MSLLQRNGIRLAAAAAVLLLTACGRGDPAAEAPAAAGEALDSLVSAAWLDEHLDDPDLVVLDCSMVVESTDDGGFRVLSGRSEYDEGHIPGAGFADLAGELSDGGSSLRFAVPAPEDFAAAMERLGVGDGTRVVLYDSSNSAWAARVWWMLRWVGFDNAALLDGGLQAWVDAELPLSTEPPAREAKSLTVDLRPELIVDQATVRAAIDDDGVQLIDALNAAHFRGDFSMYGRPGHIPGAANVPSGSLIGESGHFRPDDELDGLFDGKRDERKITYCGGGIAASADAFALTRLGYRNVAVYTASLQEWAADPDNPLETE